MTEHILLPIYLTTTYLTAVLILILGQTLDPFWTLMMGVFVKSILLGCFVRQPFVPYLVCVPTLACSQLALDR